MAILYIFPEPQTFYDCARFLCTAQFLLCCNGMFMDGRGFVVNRYTRLYSLGCAVSVICGLAYSVYVRTGALLQHQSVYGLDNLLLGIMFLELVISPCVFVVGVCLMQQQARRHIRLYDRIYAMDQRLMREFGAQLHYRKLKRKNLLVMFVIMALYTGAVCSAVAQMAGSNAGPMFLGAWCYTVITGGLHISGYLHMNLAEVVKIRFRLLQKLLNREYLQRQFARRSLQEQRARSAIHLVQEVYTIIGEINAVYKRMLLFTLTHDFTFTTSELYIIFGGSHNDYQLLGYVMFCMLLPLYKMIMTPIYCDSAINEGTKCLRLIEQVDTWFPQSEPIQRLVSAVQFWRLENKIQFYYGLNITLNKTVIAIITSAIFNYLLILIQFRQTQEKSDELNEQKHTLREWIGVL